jgi:hypothetical protein
MDGINKFMIHEALNANAYGEVNTEEFDPRTTAITSSYITQANPAKKIVLRMKAGHASSNYEDTDYLAIILNDRPSSISSRKDIKIDITDMPFTIEGLMITKFIFRLFTGYQAGVDDTHDYIELISYH